MGIARLEISNIRNLQSVRVDLSPGFNALYGLNGSGKTSFLEALYILGRGTSFKTKDLSHVLRNGAQKFFVSGKLESLNIAIGVPSVIVQSVVEYEDASPIGVKSKLLVE